MEAGKGGREQRREREREERRKEERGELEETIKVTSAGKIWCFDSVQKGKDSSLPIANPSPQAALSMPSTCRGLRMERRASC